MKYDIVSYLPQHSRVLLTLVRGAISSLRGTPTDDNFMDFDHTESQMTASPPSASLVADYVKSSGGKPGNYKGKIPFHLFPQWGFPVMMNTLRDFPYPLTNIVNGGCSVKFNGALSAQGKLKVNAKLVNVDVAERRVILTHELNTTDLRGNSIEVTQTSIVRRMIKAKEGGKDNKKKEKVKSVIPDDAREVASFYAHERSGLEYAFFSGDFNPIHWLPVYAKASGFRKPILHGFSQLARAYEHLNANLFCGNINALSGMSIRFERPFLLPQVCRVYLTDDDRYFLGPAIGANPIASGSITRNK